MLPLDYHSLLDAFKHKGCPICFLLQRDAQRMLDSIFHEHVTEPEMHEVIRKRRGLCNEHGWQLTELRGHALGIAILFRAAVDEVLSASDAFVASGAAAGGRLSRLLGKSDTGAAGLADALNPVGPCPICQHKAKLERDYQNTIAEFITEANFRAGYEASHGLCLPHFRNALRGVRAPLAAQTLVNLQAQKWRSMKAELSMLIDKYDYRRAQEQIGDEGDSHLRAIQNMVGARGMSGG